MRIGKVNFNMIGIAASIGIGAVALALLYPTTPNEVQAADDTINVATGTHATAHVKSSISIAISKAVNVDIMPRSTGAFSAGQADLLVTTNNLSGYQIFLSTTDDSQDLHPTNVNNTKTIGPVSGTMTATNYANNLNKWGYALVKGGINDNTQYRAVPKANSAAVITTEDVSQDNSYILSLGVAIDSNLPADNYTNDVLISVLANPRRANIGDITTMQQMTPELCAATAEHVSVQLTDTRDNNVYTIRKLKDGNCWMTDNLALTSQGMTGVEGSSTITPADSDVEGEWELPETKTSEGSWTSDPTEAMSMNVGNGYGTYFTFQAVTAGKGSTVTGEQEIVENSSVCPKGWKLSIAGGNYNNTSGSFYYLLSAYGSTTGGSTAVALLTGEKLNFKFGGYIASSGVIGATAGSTGTYWSSVSNSSDLAYGLDFNDSSAPLSYRSRRYFGRSVRCLAR